MRMSAIHDVRCMIVALICALSATPALALDLSTAAETPTMPPATGADDPTLPLSPDESTALGNALMFDPTTAAPAKPLRLPSVSIQHSLDIKTTEKPDGFSAMALKQPLPYDANVGADLGLASSAPDVVQPGRPLPGSRDEHNSGAAWASLGVVPNLASVDARVDPTHDQGKLGTTFKRAMPLGSNFSMTLQNSYSVTETYGTSPAGPSDLPMRAMPTVPATQPTPQVWGNEKLAKFDVLPTGTTLAAGLASTSSDPVTHNKFSAEQKLYGPLHVTTAVSDIGQPVTNKSISAGFKLNW